MPNPTTARRVALAASLTLVTSPAAHADEPSILTIAPANAWLVAHVPDATVLLEPDKDTSALGRLLDEPDVRGFLDARFNDLREELVAQAAALDLDPDDLPTPQGAIGLALVDTSDADHWAPSDPPDIHTLVWADFGEHADEADDAIERLLDRALDDGQVEFDEMQVGDIELVTVRAIAPEPDPDLEPWEVEVQTFPDTTYARVGSAFIACTDADVAAAAVEAALGEARGATMLENATVRAAIESQPRDAAIIAAMTIDPLRKSWLGFFEDQLEWDGRAIARALGINEVESISASLSLDTPDAVAEVRFDFELPEKNGVFALADEELGPLDPPAFAGPETVSIAHARFEFAGLLPLVDRVIAQMPENERAQAAMGLTQFRGMAEPVLAAVGPEFYQLTRTNKPFDEDSQQTLFAVAASDENVVTNTIMFLSGFASAKARDFEGAQIFETDGINLAAAVHAGWLFVGSTSMVEDAVRSTRAGARTLADEPPFARATGVLDGAGVASGYSNTERTLEWVYYAAEQSAEQMRGFADQMEIPADERDEFLASTAWVEELPPIETFTDHIGDGIWSIRSTDHGYRARLLWIHPQ